MWHESCSESILIALPSFVCKGDELALDFDQWHLVAVNNFRSELTADKLFMPDAISGSLPELARVGSKHWTDDAVRKSTEWQAIRALAAAALSSFGWPIEVPPSHADEYVGSEALRDRDRDIG